MDSIYRIVKEEIWDSHKLRYTLYYVMEKKNDLDLKEKWIYVKQNNKNHFINLKFKKYLEASLYVKEKLKGNLVE